MMTGIYKQPIRGRNTRRVVRFDGFTFKQHEKGFLLDSGTNCECRDGKLTRGMGVREYCDVQGNPLTTTFTGEVQGFFPVSENNTGSGNDTLRVYLVGEDGYLYLVLPTTKEAVRKFFLGSGVQYHSIIGADKKIRHLFTGHSGGCGGVENLYSVGSGGIIASCICGGRTFIARGSGRLQYSVPYSTDNFSVSPSGGGTLYIPVELGEMVGIVSCEDLYVFVERGIFRLKVSADARDFLLERLDYVGRDICARSMIRAGNSVFFLSLDGAWKVQGNTVQRICTHLSIQPKLSECKVGRCEDAVIIEYIEGTTTKRLVLAHNGENGYFVQRYGELCGNDAFCIGGRGFRFVRSVDRNFNTIPNAVAKGLDFGTPYTKHLKKAVLKGQGSAILRVQSEGITHSYALELVQGKGEVRLSDCGRVFTFTVEPKAGASLEGIEIEFDCMEVGNDH